MVCTSCIFMVNSQKQFTMGKLKIWATEEDDILRKISTETKSKRWKKASEQLHKKGYNRSDVQCRERYINHLDPSVNKQLWSDQELQILYTKYLQYGNKWFLLQKHLPGRTQTKIKNYFYGNIRYFLKIIIKHFHRQSTGFVNDIKTDTLLDLYQAKNDFEGFWIIPKTIKKIKYRVDKLRCQQIITENQEMFRTLANIFMSKYFTKNKQIEKKEQKSISQSQSESRNMVEEDSFRIVTVVSIVNSVGGQLTDPKQQIQYLNKMSINHFKWYQHYQNKYLQLQAKLNQNHD